MNENHTPDLPDDEEAGINLLDILQTLAENARHISDLGRDLYERLSTVAEHLSKLGRSLEGSLKSYNSAVSSFESRVFPAARKFRELGIDSAKTLEAPEPLDLLPRALQAPEVEELDRLL